MGSLLLQEMPPLAMSFHPPQPPIAFTKMSDYTYVAFLGNGSFGSTYRMMDPLGKQFVFKVIDAVREEEIEDVRQEYQRMKALREGLLGVDTCDRERLIEAHDCLVEATQPGLFRVCIKMEYCAGGSLMSHIQAHAPLNETAAIKVLSALLRALQALHKMDHVHCNLTPSNVLFCGDEKAHLLKLGDFGLRRALNLRSSGCGGGGGTMLHLAPELERGRYTTKADIWALGVLAAQLCTAPQEFEKQLRILRTEEQIEAFVQCIPQSVSALSRKCLALDFTKRPSAVELLASELFADDKLRFRLDELERGEQKYLRRMEIVRNVFRQPLEGHLGQENVDKIFSKSLDSLCLLHAKLLADMRAAVATEEGQEPARSAYRAAATLSALIENYAPHFKYALDYLQNHNEAQTQLRALRESDSRIDTLIKDREGTPAAAGLDLHSLMASPTQHYLRYALHLNEIHSLVADDAETARVVGRALKTVKAQAEMFDEKKRDLEEQCRVSSVASRVSGLGHYEICLPHRRVVHEGTLRAATEDAISSRLVVLFNDILLVARPERIGTHSCVLVSGGAGCIELVAVKSVDACTIGEADALQVVTATIELKLVAENSAQRDEWVRKINDAVTLTRQARFPFVRFPVCTETAVAACLQPFVGSDHAIHEPS